jgi:hypothetical protein
LIMNFRTRRLILLWIIVWLPAIVFVSIFNR